MYDSYIFQSLSYFNWTTWISPTNAALAAVTGTVTGLGLNPVPTFDWNQVTTVADPLINPFFVRSFFFLIEEILSTFNYYCV
jgi:OPT oligopeptide transporter protein